MLYRVLKPGVRQATRGGGFRLVDVGARITVSPEGARPLLARGFLAPVDAPAAGGLVVTPPAGAPPAILHGDEAVIPLGALEGIMRLADEMKGGGNA